MPLSVARLARPQILIFSLPILAASLALGAAAYAHVQALVVLGLARAATEPASLLLKH